MNLIRPPRQPRIGLADFEEMLLGRPEHEKWELVDGRIIKSMVGARWEHHRIISNVDFALQTHLRGRNSPCRVFRETFFLSKETADLHVLPDIMVFCGKLEPRQTSVDSPLIVVEVLSPGTEANDRLAKRIAYQNLESLQSYVLIERDRVLVDIYRREADGWHGDPPLDRLDATLQLPEIEFAMSVADVYRDLTEHDTR